MNKPLQLTWWVAFILALAIRCSAAQDFDYGGQAVSVTRQFVKGEIEGGRTTPEGWRNVGNQFFLHPDPPPKICAVTVVSKKYFAVLTSLTDSSS